MRKIVLFFVLIQLGTLTCKNQEILLIEEKKFNFGKYKIITGGCDSGSAVFILKHKKIVFQNFGGDGIFMSFDTISITNDHIPDFIFTYAFDDYTTLGMLLSCKDRKRFRILNLTDNIFKSIDCSLEPYSIDDNRIKDFIISDINNDGLKEVITLAVQNPNHSITCTQCSMVFTHDQLLEISNYK
jgi:hypothetical protein